MNPIRVRAGERTYEVLAGAGLLARAGELIAPKLKGPACAIVSDENVAALYAETAQSSLSEAGFRPVVITVFADRSFTFETKTPPAADLLKKAAGIPKGSGNPKREKVGTISRAKIEEIARTKMPDLNTHDLAAAVRTIEGTARQMGLTVE